MIRELKESNVKMMRTISEQFAQLATSNREIWGSLFDPNDVQKVNAIIFLGWGEKVDTHMGGKNVSESLSLSSSFAFP